MGTDKVPSNAKDFPDYIYASDWLPQVECLAHPAVKAGVSHCGFGGTLEFISNGLPVLCFDHFADQPGNAGLMVHAGAALLLKSSKLKTERVKDEVFAMSVK